MDILKKIDEYVNLLKENDFSCYDEMLAYFKPIEKPLKEEDYKNINLNNMLFNIVLCDLYCSDKETFSDKAKLIDVEEINIFVELFKQKNFLRVLNTIKPIFNKEGYAEEIDSCSFNNYISFLKDKTPKEVDEKEEVDECSRLEKKQLVLSFELYNEIMKRKLFEKLFNGDEKKIQN